MKWYDLKENGNKVLPVFEDAESGLSVDVLVFGYHISDHITPGATYAMFGIGYTDRLGVWRVHTVNGVHGIDQAFKFVPLKWAYLPDEPAEIPLYAESVKNNPRKQDIEWLPNAEESPDPMASPYTAKPPDWLPH